MKRAKVMFASVLETIHGLGVSGLASCLLAKGALGTTGRARHAEVHPLLLLLFMVVTLLHSADASAQAPEQWWTGGQEKLSRAYDETLRIAADMEDAGNARGVSTALKLVGVIELSKSYFEHTVTIDQLDGALDRTTNPMDRDFRNMTIGLRCIDVQADESTLLTSIRRNQRRGEYKSYDDVVTLVIDALKSAINRCQALRDAGSAQSGK